MKKIRIVSASLLIIVMLFMSISIPGAQASSNPSALPSDARVQGLTLGDWAAKFWQSIFAVPAAENPLIPGNLWSTCYLTRVGNVGVGVGYGSSGSVECEMPDGMMLYVLVVGSECSTAEPPPFYGANEEELRACVLQFAQSNLYASVDGIQVRNIEDYTTLSPLYQFTLPEDNVLGAPAGTYDSVALQTGFLLAPLSPGEHIVHVHGEIPYFGFIYDFVYNITVTN